MLTLQLVTEQWSFLQSSKAAAESAREMEKPKKEIHKNKNKNHKINTTTVIARLYKNKEGGEKKRNNKKRKDTGRDSRWCEVKMLLCSLSRVCLLWTQNTTRKKGNRRAEEGAVPLPVEKEQEGTKEQREKHTFQ